MIPQTKAAKNEPDFAEQCRMALEKSFGMPVPKPKCLSKRQQLSDR
jgi:hypothetical protein